ncbi:hypothetical protein D3C87_1213270 [compost metagenome]
MKFNKKVVLTLTLALTGAISLGAVSSFAIDPITNNVQSIEKSVEINNKMQPKNLVQVGNEFITNIELSNYKVYNSVGPNNLLDDVEILKQMAREKLYLQLAKEKKLEATLEEGRAEAKKNRELLNRQTTEIQNIQKKFIDSMGLSEDQYWNDFAPAEYQKILTSKNLTKNLIEDQIIKADQYNNEFGKQLDQFKQKLYLSSLKNKTLKALDSSIHLD